MIIILTGDDRSRTSIAEALCRIEPQCRRIALYDAIARAAMGIFDLTYDQVFDPKHQRILDPGWTESPLSLTDQLRQFGESAHPLTWVRALKRDMRMFNEHRLFWHFDTTVNVPTWRLTSAWATHTLGGSNVWTRSDGAAVGPIWVIPDLDSTDQINELRKDHACVVIHAVDAARPPKAHVPPDMVIQHTWVSNEDAVRQSMIDDVAMYVLHFARSRMPLPVAAGTAAQRP